MNKTGSSGGYDWFDRNILVLLGILVGKTIGGFWGYTLFYYSIILGVFQILIFLGFITGIIIVYWKNHGRDSSDDQITAMLNKGGKN